METILGLVYIFLLFLYNAIDHNRNVWKCLISTRARNHRTQFLPKWVGMYAMHL